MDGFCDKFLAGTALTLDQDRTPAGGNLRDEIEHLEHLLAFANDVAVPETLFQRPAQVKVLAGQLTLLDPVRDDHHELFVIPWLGDVIERSFFNSSYRSLHSPDGGNDDDG